MDIDIILEAFAWVFDTPRPSDSGRRPTGAPDGAAWQTIDRAKRTQLLSCMMLFAATDRMLTQIEIDEAQALLGADLDITRCFDWAHEVHASQTLEPAIAALLASSGHADALAAMAERLAAEAAEPPARDVLVAFRQARAAMR